mmetsp:Transcript_14543/g.20342  ORF Transcript_14543/g.20342 Transcript_14543/m.20342 type:complete len:91 (-) Transcript_14543:515-787(-)
MFNVEAQFGCLAAEKFRTKSNLTFVSSGRFIVTLVCCGKHVAMRDEDATVPRGHLPILFDPKKCMGQPSSRILKQPRCLQHLSQWQAPGP